MGICKRYVPVVLVDVGTMILPNPANVIHCAEVTGTAVETTV